MSNTIEIMMSNTSQTISSSWIISSTLQRMLNYFFDKELLKIGWVMMKLSQPCLTSFLRMSLYQSSIMLKFSHIEHCSRRKNVWMANLRHKYFNSHWAMISFLAVVFLLLLALAQSIFFILSYIVSN
jgi:hypothetical protein